MTDATGADLRVGITEREQWMTPRAEKRASVAFPVIDLPEWGLCTAVTLRATRNGHNGERMSHAGDVVLFGGSMEPGETTSQAALRELCEESTTLDRLDDPSYRVSHHLGRWVTESGFIVDGHRVDLPPSFFRDARPDPREVDRIGFLRLDPLLRSAPGLAYHEVDPRDTQITATGRLFFESPTIVLPDAETGEPWTLWGVAGFMAAMAPRTLVPGTHA